MTTKISTYEDGGREWFRVEMKNSATLHYSRGFEGVLLRFMRNHNAFIYSEPAFDELLEVLLEIRKGM